LLMAHCLKKIDRVSFGIMTADDLSKALATDPNMPLSRTRLAIPFVGKDVPSPTNEFAHPDIIIGLSVVGYRYEGLRPVDIGEIVAKLLTDFRKEPGRPQDRPTAIIFREWVEDAGGCVCDPANPDNVSEATDQDKQGVPPLNLILRSNETQMKNIHKLLQNCTPVIHWYLEQLVLPKYMRFQSRKLSASGQELGGEILFSKRIGFSARQLNYCLKIWGAVTLQQVMMP